MADLETNRLTETYQTEEEEIVQSENKLCHSSERKPLSKQMKRNISEIESEEGISLVDESQFLSDIPASGVVSCDQGFSVRSEQIASKTSSSEELSPFDFTTGGHIVSKYMKRNSSGTELEHAWVSDTTSVIPSSGDDSCDQTSSVRSQHTCSKTSSTELSAFDVATSVNARVTKTMMTSDLPSDVVKSTLSNGLPNEVAKTMMTSDLPNEVVKSTLSHGLPSKVVKTIMTSDLPSEVVKTMMTSDLPSEVVKTIMTSGLPSEVVKTMMTSGLPSEVVKTIMTSDLPSEVVKTMMTSDLPSEVVKTMMTSGLPSDGGHRMDDSCVNNDEENITETSTIIIDMDVHSYVVLNDSCASVVDAAVESKERTEISKSELGGTIQISEYIPNVTEETGNSDLRETIAIKQNIGETSESNKTKFTETRDIKQPIANVTAESDKTGLEEMMQIKQNIANETESCKTRLGEMMQIKQNIANDTESGKNGLHEMMQIKQNVANETESGKTGLEGRGQMQSGYTADNVFDHEIGAGGDGCSVIMEIVDEDQALEGPVIELGEEGDTHLDYMHVFWVDEESEVRCEEDAHENSIRQITKRERDRQKKRAMRANPEYREKETAKARLRMKMRRQDPVYREQERRRDRDRRRQARCKNCVK